MASSCPTKGVWPSPSSAYSSNTFFKIMIRFLFTTMHTAIRYKGLVKNEKYNSYCKLYISAPTLLIPFLTK